jgi:hypothetical protein
MRHSFFEGNCMKRLFHHFFTFLSAVSLLLCVAVCVLWARNYFGWRVEGVNFEPRTRAGDTKKFHYALVVNPFGIAFMQSSHAPLSPHILLEAQPAVVIDPTEYSFAPSPAKWDVFSRTATSATLATLSEYYRGRGADGILGVYWLATMEPNSGNAAQEVFLPHWLLALASGALPALWGTRRWRKRAKTRAGLCAVCGYDLRASPQRCPECGTLSSPRITA